jgi:ubiquinone/menaquinone biosynthesis C-methylase UbiE
MRTNLDRWIKEDGMTFFRDIGLECGQTVLDFGCGEGHYTIPASKVVGMKGKVFALDKNEKVLVSLKVSIKKANLENVEIINGDSRIPLKNNSIDFALCYDVIHYEKMEERKKIYNEINRILKQKGIFSVYPKHHRGDDPIMELANVTIESIIDSIEDSDFILDLRISKRLLHDDHFNEGLILNFRKGGYNAMDR